MPAIIPIHAPMPGGNVRLTEQDINTMIGMLVILTVVWIIWLVRTVPRYRAAMKNRPDKPETFMSWIVGEEAVLFVVVHMFACSAWGLLLLIYLGSQIGKLL